MAKVKVRKIGNSLGVLLPKESGVHEGDELEYAQEGDKIILDTQEAQNARVREIVENSFKDFETGNVLTEDDMVRIFGKYGWHK
ncbi:AbrB/MazE/SpoVT family DNA-binding domain-containing protein [Lentilactobacillus buchneri]|uniref:SpoVT-AbrB domain-containing protein n=1 Tax=Lentilactobacillus buchneri subsp. silagei CD034 TaxID=1071400 RepID=J9VZ72_LENBU|nr:AbrB family transcriptional regulator [Lentilactobacillus buchneri]MCC6101294.1 AbrB family transcriptional regulator [Lactobacillus sp.]AFR99672.1 hypothetical protein LBUCD034_0576 [Lentilactobacillus buchneri subsp. silagei CD034]MCT2902093.1 AbrB family transcriptional regulator [Lentilactobacillus buchneri]MCT3543169.1 AbrB family transcriptional regulator [Lentilactobacillus buchneri]MCT3544119.1 AbrB family transcriptional regulator [Lentilactobacillus buchneri]